jgi:hypothetical protein
MLSEAKHLGFERKQEILHGAMLRSDAVLSLSKEWHGERFKHARREFSGGLK